MVTRAALIEGQEYTIITPIIKKITDDINNQLVKASPFAELMWRILPALRLLPMSTTFFEFRRRQLKCLHGN